MTRPRVRFVIGGTQKGGTTALAHYLAQHPDVRLPKGKEAHVFDAPGFDDDADAARIDEAYASHFAGQPPGGLHGDATPIYMLHPLLVDRIARYNPRMRWVLLLRDPAERAVSQYHMERARSLERWPLLPAMLLERPRLAGHGDDFGDGSPLRTFSYRLRGDYARQLDAIHARFPSDQVKLLRSEDLRRDPAACVQDVLDFLGLPAPSMPLDLAPVFKGRYRAPSAATMALLRWLLRRERRELARRYGITF